MIGRAEELLRDNLVRVDVGAVHRGDKGGMGSERLRTAKGRHSNNGRSHISTREARPSKTRTYPPPLWTLRFSCGGCLPAECV